MKKQCECGECNLKNLKTGTMQVRGTYSCDNCGQKVYLDAEKTLPKCPKCGFDVFTKE